MSTDLSAADAEFREWMRENLQRAADHFGLAIAGEPRLGWLDRSIGASALRDGQKCWLRVVSEDKRWAGGDFWTGNADANVFTGLAKPRVLDVHEWEEGRQQRAEVMTLVPGSPCSPTDALRQMINLSDTWWTELRRTLEVVAATPTTRISVDQDLVTSRIRQRFGEVIGTAVSRWETAHGDLHWGNLMQPEFGLLDWEMWGRGPAGTDAATLFCYSLLVPDAAARVRVTFHDILDTDAGQLAQLYVISRLLRRIEKGDYPDLAAPLTAHAETLLGE